MNNIGNDEEGSGRNLKCIPEFVGVTKKISESIVDLHFDICTLYLLNTPDRPWGPPSLLYNGHRVFPGGKERPGRDADPSTPSSAVVKKE